MRFRSTLPPLPDSFVLIFMLFDILMSVLLVVPMALCVLAALAGIAPPGIPSPVFGIGFLAVACYFALMIYGFSLDFRSAGADALEIDDRKVSFLLRKKVKLAMDPASVSSVKLVKIRLFVSYAYYAVFAASGRAKAVAEISEKDYSALGSMLPEMGLDAGKRSEIPFFITTGVYRR